MHRAECRVRVEVLLAQEDPAAAQVEEPAAGEAQASSSSSAPAGVQDAGSSAPDVPMDAGSSAPLVRQDEVSAMAGTNSNAVVTKPLLGVAVAAEHEKKRPRTVSGLLVMHEPERVAALCGASLGNLCGITSELQPVPVTVEHQKRMFGAKTRVELDPVTSATRTATGV